MEIIGIIDVGSNSIRLVVAEIYEGKAFKVIYEIKESVKLAKDMTADGQLAEARMELAIDTLKLFKDVCLGFNVSEIISVATAAVRAATNQAYFLNRVSNEVGINIRVLSGIEEAYYDYFGIMNSMSISDGIIMDIGGASTEIIWVKNREFKEAISLPFGAINLSERFNLLDEPDSKNKELVNKFIMENFNDITWLKSAKDLPIIGIGGTVRNIGKIDSNKKDYPLEIIHNYPIEAQDVIDIYDTVKDMNLKQRKKVKGLSKERADIFLGAITIVKCLIKYINCPKLFVSGSGVREGLIYDTMLKSKEPIDDVLEFSLESLIYLHRLNKNHSNQIWNLCYELFIGLKTTHCMDREVLKILKTSSLLYNIGIDVNYYNKKEHSFYMILNSRINGLNHKEKLMSALIVSILKKEGIQSYIVKYRELFSEDDINIIQMLALILKTSVDLNLRKINNIKSVQVNTKEDVIFIQLDYEKNPTKEISAAMSSAPNFEKIFNKKLIIQ